MATNTANLSLLQTIPDSLGADPQVQACCVALDPEFQDVVADIPQIYILTNIAGQSSSMLDYLAVQFNVDFYDSTLPIATKIALIEGNLDFHSRKGTPAIIQQLITTVITDATVLEWWQYNGQPYHFKVLTQNGITDPTQLALATKMVIALKNVRSWFDGFAIIVNVPTSLYVTTGVILRYAVQLPLAT